MSRSRPLLSRMWILLLLGAVLFVGWCDARRIDRVDYVTGIAQDAAATTAEGGRQLIVPEHIAKSFGWIEQTQQMVGQREWRVRWVDYDNAPQGRPVFAASLYRWWLGLVGAVIHGATAKPWDAAIERAACYADPALHLMLLVFTTVFVARRFGGAAASVTALGLAAVFPFCAGFLPAVPDDFALVLILAPWSVIPLLAALCAGAGANRTGTPTSVAATEGASRRGFAIAGVLGGLMIWVNVPLAVPLLAGVALGALLASWVQRPNRPVAPVPVSATEGDPAVALPAMATAEAGVVDPVLWRIWSLAGATTVLVACLIEYFPAHLAHWELRSLHPLYGLGWLGGGEVLVRLAAWIQRSKTRWTWGDGVAMLLGLAALGAVPVLMWKTGDLGFLAPDLLSFRLTKQPDGIMAPNFAGWLLQPRGTGALWATLLPLLAVPLAAILAGRRTIAVRQRAVLALALGPVLLAVAFAYFHLRWWQLLDGLLIALVIAITLALFDAAVKPAWRWIAVALGLAMVGLGVGQSAPWTGAAAKNVVTVPEVEGLVERDLAQWLAVHHRTPGTPTVLAPPSLTAALCYYGGLRGLGTLDWENKEGLSVALRIVISTSREEALALIRKRGVTHIVMPSWDDFFAGYMGPASVQNGELFFASLDRWSLPSWLRPVPYPLPAIPGFEANSVKVFEVVDDQGDPLAASRLAEYFIEMGQADNARLSEQLLRRYPADLGTWVARGQLCAALGDSSGLAAVLDTLVKRIGTGADRFLPWDRRVSLAIVLARGQRVDLARVQAERALKDVNAARLHELTPYSLYHFLGLVKGLGLAWPDPDVRVLALGLLPPELRERVR